jgi:hypothetical protein
MTSDDQLDQLLRRAGTAISPIDDDRAAALWEATSSRRRRRSNRRICVAMILAAAACLVVGFGVGRWARPELANQSATVAATFQQGDRPELARLIREGLPLLRDVEHNPAEARLSGVDEMLWLTRRLRDAPPSGDSAVELLLSDLELILVQLLDASRDTTTVERTLAGEAVIARAIVPRMHQLDQSLRMQ